VPGQRRIVCGQGLVGLALIRYSSLFTFISCFEKRSIEKSEGHAGANSHSPVRPGDEIPAKPSTARRREFFPSASIVGAPDRNQIAMNESKIKHPNDEVGMNGQIGLPQK